MDRDGGVPGKLKELLVGVFNLESAERISLGDSLVGDLGADSLDFVEIIHLVEQNFHVVLKADQIMVPGGAAPPAGLFVDGRLTREGAEALRAGAWARREQIREGLGKVEMFTLLTVGDLAMVIGSKMAEGKTSC